MINILLYILVPVAFLIGSIPFGVLFTQKKGIDIRSAGSRNIGATNVLRTAGKRSALLTLVCDILKGALPVILCRLVISYSDKSLLPAEAAGFEDFWLGITGLSAVTGHMFSVFLSFRGGKGVATGFGVLAVYSPATAGIMLLIWISVAFIFKYSSLAAISAVTAMPFILALFDATSVKIAIGSLISVLIIYKHRTNIKDLMTGMESKIGKKS